MHFFGTDAKSWYALRVKVFTGLCCRGILSCFVGAANFILFNLAFAQDVTPIERVKRPSVILITVDTLRADYVSNHNSPLAQTPHLKTLALQGWSFTECFSASMLTNPSHASIMTSLYPKDHNVYDNESGIATNTPSLAQTFLQQGYATHAVINFPHLNPNVSNLGQGFQQIVKAQAKERRANDTTLLALTTLDNRNQTQPFFMWLHYTDPHAPYDPPQSYISRQFYQGISIKTASQVAPAFQRNNLWFQNIFHNFKFIEDIKERYRGEVEYTDAQLGRLFQGLRDRNLWHDAIVVVTSDHGENLGEHNLFFHHGSLYETTTHVPLIIKPSDSTQEEKDMTITSLVETVDIAPTLLELTGLPSWNKMRGQSLLANVRGQTPSRSYVFNEHMLGQMASIRSREYSLILHRKNSNQFPSYKMVRGKKEFYDRLKDKDEQSPLPLSHTAYVMEQQLVQLLSDSLQLASVKGQQQDRESLRALGYVE